MALRVLVKTGFALTLNPKDRHHKWAMKVLEEARKGEILLHVSPATSVKLSLIMEATGIGTYSAR